MSLSRGSWLVGALLVVGCSVDGTTPNDAAVSVDDLGPELPGAVILVPRSVAVAEACATEVTQTACTTRDAAALVASCRAKLAARGVACTTPADCLVTYRPLRDATCRGGATYPAPTACAEPVPDDCAFYRSCLESSHPCGADGYAVAFGERLCNAFIAQREQFTPAGQAWLRGVRTCLQRSLVPLNAMSGLTCGALEDAAYASHAACYTVATNSVCSLPPADLAALTRILAPYLRDPRVVQQIGAVLRSCSDAGT